MTQSAVRAKSFNISRSRFTGKEPDTESGNDYFAVQDFVMGTWTFQYDALNRLLSGAATAGTYNGQYACWGYDDFGNRTAEALSTTTCSNNPPLLSWATYNVSNTNRMDTDSTSNLYGRNPAYDAAGDLTSDGGNTYIYDAEGRICAVQSTPLSGYTAMTGYLYNAEGERVAKGTITTLSCDPASNGFTLTGSYVLGQGGEELTQFSVANGVSTWQRTNVYGAGKQLATYDVVSYPALHFQLTDPLGTRRVQTDAYGRPETDIQSLPYGDQLSSAPDQYAPATADDATPLHFTGKERDTESGNDYFGARYYASSMGRFMSPDPAGPWAADVSDPQSWNFYAYARNNPLINIDPDGYDCVYLNNAGNGVESVDQNSSQTECMGDGTSKNKGTGGYWVDGTATSGTYNPNNNDITLNGYEAGSTPGTGQLTSADYTSVTASPADSVPNMFVFSPTQSLPSAVLSNMISALNFSGQSDALIGCIVGTESSGRPGVKNANSSATGLMGVESGKNGTGDIARGAGGTFQGMNGDQLYAHAKDPAANIAMGSRFVKQKIGYAKGNVQNGLDMYGTGAPYGKDRLACANGH